MVTVETLRQILHSLPPQALVSAYDGEDTGLNILDEATQARWWVRARCSDDEDSQEEFEAAQQQRRDGPGMDRPVAIHVPKEQLARLLDIAEDNTMECYNAHIGLYGARETQARKHRVLTEFYESELSLVHAIREEAGLSA